MYMNLGVTCFKMRYSTQLSPQKSFRDTCTVFRLLIHVTAFVSLRMTLSFMTTWILARSTAIPQTGWRT